jgi:hypothetical protein
MRFAGSVSALHRAVRLQFWFGPLHLLVNDAGVMACPQSSIADGWELQSRPTISATSRWPPGWVGH